MCKRPTRLFVSVVFTCFLYPKKAPIKVRGTEIPNHNARMAMRVVNGIAAELPQPHKKRFKMKKIMKTNLNHKYRLIPIDGNISFVYLLLFKTNAEKNQIENKKIHNIQQETLACFHAHILRPFNPQTFPESCKILFFVV